MLSISRAIQQLLHLSLIEACTGEPIQESIGQEHALLKGLSPISGEVALGLLSDLYA
jgi:hypothetical protein